MKYSIEISGGFTGIPRQFVGDMPLPAKEEETLMDAMEDQDTPKNEYLRDSRVYVIELAAKGASRKSTFTDTTLPPVLRRFMDTIGGEGDSIS